MLDGKYGIWNKTLGILDGIYAIGNKTWKKSFFLDITMANICVYLHIIIWQNQHQLRQSQRQS